MDNLKHDNSNAFSKADWLAELSAKARADGDTARADHLLLLAWLAYDGQDVTLDDLDLPDFSGEMFNAA